MDLVIVGSVALDDVRTPAGEVKNALGGSAVYASIAAGYFAEPGVVGVVGRDFLTEHVDLLHHRGIDTQGLERAEGDTFHWAGYYEHDMGTAYTLDTQLNVFATFSPKIPGSYRESPFLFLANIDPNLQMEVLGAMGKPRFTMLDTMNLWIEIKREALLEVIAKVDMVVVNDAEARQLSGKSSLIAAARWIQEQGPRGVAVKKGEHGALLFWENDLRSLPAYPVTQLQDPTGAGDTFAGGMMGALAQQETINADTLMMAASVGTVMASFTVEDFSVGRLAHLQDAEVTQRHEAIRKMSRIPDLALTIPRKK